MTAILIGGRCRQCGKTKPWGELVGDESRGYLCAECQDWHNHALQVLAGATPRGCQVCYTTFAQLRERTSDNARMVLVPKDGIYQLLCKPCESLYAPRSGFYRGTLYEKLKKHAGFK